MYSDAVKQIITFSKILISVPSHVFSFTRKFQLTFIEQQIVIR